MRRKKWTEEEEETLIRAYSDLVVSSGSGISQLRTREKKFEPIAERVNSAHHLRDPSAFPFLWSWRDVSIKVQNMRHQYLGVKLKLSSSSSDHDALRLWPNFLSYQSVFGDVEPPSPSPSSSSSSSEEERAEGLGKTVAELGEVLALREQGRMEEEEGRRWRRRRMEEKREEEEMEWREKMMGMQMEHQKQVMQIQAEASQAQFQMLALLARLVCQFLSPSAAASGLQQHQQQDSPPPGNLKDDVRSGEDYL